jgi:hypothetical protein
MRHSSLAAFLQTAHDVLAQGPFALLLAEDAVEIESTVLHHLQAGFRAVLLLADPDIALPAATEAQIHRIDHDTHSLGAVQAAVNRVIEAAPGAWIYYGFNAEYLFHPFCEQRNIREMLAFHTEERRDAVLSYTIDLYADDLDRFPDAVSLTHAMLDRTGYYALGRTDPANHGHPKERQLDFFAGGLKNISPWPSARLTASPCFVPNRGWCCAPISPSRMRSTTPMPAPGTTTLPPLSSLSAPPRP